MYLDRIGGMTPRLSSRRSALSAASSCSCVCTTAIPTPDPSFRSGLKIHTPGGIVWRVGGLPRGRRIVSGMKRPGQCWVRSSCSLVLTVIDCAKIRLFTPHLSDHRRFSKFLKPSRKTRSTYLQSKHTGAKGARE
jgi:hypothetical protein